MNLYNKFPIRKNRAWNVMPLRNYIKLNSNGWLLFKVNTLKQTFRKINNASYGLLKHKYGKPFTPLTTTMNNIQFNHGNRMHSNKNRIVDSFRSIGNCSRYFNLHYFNIILIRDNERLIELHQNILLFKTLFFINFKFPKTVLFIPHIMHGGSPRVQRNQLVTLYSPNFDEIHIYNGKRN